MTDGDTTWSYTYDANGMRTSRTNGTKTYNYVYNGSQLTQMTVGNDTLYFTYGLLGPTTVTWNGTTYYYALNIQGDVVGIYDEAGNPVVTYNWDNAWGYNPIPEGVMASTLGTLNPLRYRSYVYDTETGYYYLQSRYYDPEIGRFIHADVFASTGQGLLSNNMFVYCLNNPVLYFDRNGEYPLLPPLIDNGLTLPPTGGIPVVIDGTTYYYAVDYQNGQLYEYWFDGEGNLIWGRHHSDHNKPWKHSDPHDHKGGKDKDGNNTLVNGPQPVDEKFHRPDQSSYKRETNLNTEYIAAGVVVSVIIYQVAKWTIATILAPTTGGCSFAVAALAP